MALCYIYDPITDTYTPAASLNIGRGNHTQIELANGRVMALAGITTPSDTPISSYEIYNAATNVWTLFPSSPINGNYPGMISNVCGEVFAWGGHNSSNNSTNVSYEYDVATDTWTALPNFPIAVAGQAYGQFSDGKIIACGGYQTNTTTVTNKTYLAG